jgi:hypothetical protein
VRPIWRLAVSDFAECHCLIARPQNPLPHGRTLLQRVRRTAQIDRGRTLHDTAVEVAMRFGRRSRLAVRIGACLAAILLGTSCAAIHAYSRRAGQDACAGLYQCLIYDEAGRHEVPCYYSYGFRRYLYPGDHDWPFEPGVCPPTTRSSG